jgi:DNA-directed RNA polymerase subunit RPC12/RpoP
MGLEAKCPECSRKAEMDDETQDINCSYCGFHALFDEYIEIMKGRAEVMADEFQSSSDKKQF